MNFYNKTMLKYQNTTAVVDFRLPEMKKKIEEKHKNLLVDTHNIFFCVLTFCGVFPISADHSGRFKVKMRSRRFIYSAIFQVLAIIISVCLTISFVRNLFTYNFTLLTYFYYSFCTAFPFFNIAHLLMFLEASKMASYLTDWTDFQICFEKVTKTRFTKIPSKIKVTATILLTFVLSVLIFIRPFLRWVETLLAENNLDPLFHYIAIVLAVVSTTVMGIQVFYWIFLTSIVRFAANALINDIESLRWIRNGYIEQYVLLWHKLRQQCIGIGTVLSWSNIYCCGLMYMSTIPSLYIFLGGETVILLIIVNSFAYLSMLAEISHRTSRKVGGEFQDRLTRLATSGRALGHEQELMMFAQTIGLNPTSISLGEYFVLDRGINIPLFSSIITYVIVMIQFKPDLEESII